MSIRSIILAFCAGFYFFAVWAAGPALSQSFPTPRGYAGMIEREPDLTYPGRQNWRVDMDLLRRVNDHVNANPYVPDDDGDRWGVGSDCEDYAVLKMATLMQLGVPRGAMRLAIVDLWGVAHAVLIVNDIWILDNLTSTIYNVFRYPGDFIGSEDKGVWRAWSNSVGLLEVLP
jgi:predicted transglutaminase-like cysteine proteinase